MKLNEVRKGLEALKTLVDQSEDYQLTFAGNRQEIEEKFASLLSSLENIMDKPDGKKESAGGMTLTDLNDKYIGKYLYFNGDEAGCQYIYVDGINKVDDMFAVNGTMLTVDYQDYKIEIEEIKNFLFADFFYFDDYDEPIETCEELDRALQSNPIDTDLPSHVVTRKKVIEDINSILGSLFGEESGDDTIDEMFSNVQVPTI